MTNATVGNWTYDARSSAGVQGPWGDALNWNNTLLFAVGENYDGSLKGHELGLVQTASFGSPFTWSVGNVLGPLYLGGCIRPDKAVLHPDPAVNELWVSCPGSMETMTVKMGASTSQTVSSVQDWQAFTVNGDIASPNFASTHAGTFVTYSSSGTGSVLSDNNGLQGTARATMKTLDKGPTS